MRSLFSTLALLSTLAVSAAVARADTFTATGSGSGFSSTETLVATSNGGGSFTINSISGPGISGLILPGLFDGNDNLLFPGSASLVDSHGFAFMDTVGDTGFKVDIFSIGPGSYEATFLDSDGFGNTVPISFSLTPVLPTPEPSGLLLLSTGVLGLAGVARRRLRV